MTSSCDVAIVGGGIGGLTLAASLLQQSISVQVFEQDTELREIGAGVAIGGNATSNRVPATPDQALSIFAEYGWDRRILDLVRNIEGDMSFWALVDLPRLPRWSRGRVVLVGDAAHAPLPHQGQGAGQAIEDAYALGALLAKDGLTNYGAAFQSFEHLRKRRTSLVQAYSRVAGRALQIRRSCGSNPRCELAVAAAADWLVSQISRGRDGATALAFRCQYSSRPGGVRVRGGRAVLEPEAAPLPAEAVRNVGPPA